MQSAKQFSTALQSGFVHLAWYALWVVALAWLNGCGPKYVAAPDSPMLIVEARGSVQVAMRDGEDMVIVGWIDAAQLEGQTVVQFDWSEDE